MRRVIPVLIIVFLVASLLWTAYSWSSSYESLFTKKPLNSIAVELQNGKRVLLESYISGDPLLDINRTVYRHYEEVTIVLGSEATREYCDSTKKCQARGLAAAEVACMVGKLMGAWYYESARGIGYNDTSARIFAMEQVTKRVKSSIWLSTKLKLEIGRGDVGNERHLLIVLRGPRDGAVVNRIYVPRPGVMVIEAIDDETLYEEVLILEGVTGTSCFVG